MKNREKNEGVYEAQNKLINRRRIILRELQQRLLWFITLRWWVPPAIVAGVFAARALGFEFAAGEVILVSVFILAYNVAFHFWSYRIAGDLVEHENYIIRFTYYQVVLDYVAMFLLIHLTGGAASPFIFFFIFHIIFASILLPPTSSFVFAAIAGVGMIVVAVAEYMQWVPHHPVVFRDASINLASQPVHVAVELAFFNTSVFVTAFFATAIVRMLRKRILRLRKLSETLYEVNKKLNALFSMVQAIGATRNREKVFDTVTRELAQVMEVDGISIKLLDNDGKTLRYKASYGLPEELIKDKAVNLSNSKINRRIIEGEPYVTGSVARRGIFQFGEDLAAAGIDSALFVPLSMEDKVIGILGAYCQRTEYFSGDDVEFFQLAAGLVAIAIDNATAYEAIEQFNEERSRFMMRVAHNLRAPLAAMLSILETVREEYHGELNNDQKEYLRRVDRRARTMISMINELLTLARNRAQIRKPRFERIDLKTLTGRLKRTFQDEAAERKLRLVINLPDGVPDIRGDFEMVEQMMENLISNAIKYTPSGGKVEVCFSKGNGGTVCIEVKDDGIGIPKEDMKRLFTEFFRAENAKTVEEVGTGLGLAVVKEIVDKHGGRIIVESEEGLGTLFAVYLPQAEKEENNDE